MSWKTINNKNLNGSENKSVPIVKLAKLLIIITIMLQSCFPKFYEEKIIKEIRQNNVSVKWVEVIGILDQNFPDYISIYQKNIMDTIICKSHNIADLQMKNDTIIIDFYGTPILYDSIVAIPKEIFNFKIISLIK